MARKKLAALVSIYRTHSHAQHIVDRFLEGYGWNGRHHRPDIDVVSLYVDQVGEDDLSHEREARHEGLTIYPTIGDALTLGGNDLAVDGVLLIAEHGEYESNEKDQVLWPRYEFFQQMATVFRTSGRSVPVFNDKHLSWNWAWARQMVDTSRELDFPFMAGSSLPVTWRTPSIDMPLGANVDEAMCVNSSWIDGGDFHAYETVQAMVERRAGGEGGVRWIKAYRGEEFWQAHHDRQWSHKLFNACLCRSHNLNPGRPGFNDIFPTIDAMRGLMTNPWAYQYQHLDGLLCTVIAGNGLVGDFNFAAQLRDTDEPLSTNMYLAAPPTKSMASFFSPLVNNMEQMFLTGRATYPVERTLLTTGLTASGLDSRFQGDQQLDTPHLNIAYEAPAESTYWRT